MSSPNEEFKKVQYKNSKTNGFKQRDQRDQRADQELRNLQKRIHSPKVDLIERETYYYVRIELPGVDESSIKIVIKDDQIVLISGSKIPEEVYESDRIVYKESKFNDFTRRVKLPGLVLPFNNVLNFSNGVLRLNFYKSPSTTESFENLSLSNTPQEMSWADM